MSSLVGKSAAEITALVSSREVSAREVALAHLEHIEAVELRLHALLTVTREVALSQADNIDTDLQRGKPAGPLAGVPIVLKDNICTHGIRTTCGSKMLPDFVSPYDATVVTRLRAAGAVLLGKSNCDEFAMGSSTENSGYGPSRNPWNLDCVPGGSSGGSAAAVSAEECVVALGSDTGGSIRQPAALTGVVGMKPTYGRVSRYGLVAYASSLDQIGPFGRSVRDAALMLQAISGRDPMDSTSAPVEVPNFAAACGKSIAGLRIGVPREYFGAGVDAGVEQAVRAAIEALCALGAEAEEVRLPSTDHALAAYYIIAPAEASSNLARYDGVRYGHRSKAHASHAGLSGKSRSEGFGDEVKQRIMIGTYALSAGYYDAYYKRAQQVRTVLRAEFDRAFEKYDVLATPTSPTVAFKIGEKADDPLAMKLADVCTVPVNMAGLPAISVPCGFVDDLPVGLQLIAKPFAEETLFQAAHAYEQTAGWHSRRPVLS